jgi:hypothetical protein
MNRAPELTRICHPNGLGRGTALGIQCIGKPCYDFVLHIEQVGDGLVEALGPEVIAGFGVD